MAATMDRTYSVSVKGIGEKSCSKVLYDKLLKVNAHEQFVDIADRAGSDVIKAEHVLYTVKALKDEVTFKTVDKHETASILIDMQYRHIVFVYEKVHVQEEVLADGDDSSRPKKDAFAVLMEAKSSKRVLPRRKVSSSGMASGSGISNLDKLFNLLITLLEDRSLSFMIEKEGDFVVQVCRDI